MALRELIIQLTTRADTRDLSRLQAGLESATARVSELDAGLSGVAGGARAAATASSVAIQQLAGIAGAAADEMGQAFGEAFSPLAERASAAAVVVGERLAAINAAVTANLVNPIKSAGSEAFGPLAARASAAARTVSVALTQIGAAVQRSVVAPIQSAQASTAAAMGRVNASIQSGLAGPLKAAQGVATAAGNGIANAFAPVMRAANRVSATVRPMLDPMARAASESRGVLTTWGQQISAIASRAANDIRAKIVSASQSATSAVGGMSRKLQAQRDDSPAGSKGGGESKGGLLTAGAAGAVAGLAVGAVVQGARALADYGSQALETANQIKALSATTGASGQAIQIWTAIAKSSGAGPDAVKGSFKGLAAAVDGANNGNKEFTALFNQLGVSVKDAEGKTRPMGTLLREVGGALGEIQDPAQRAVATQKLLSEAGLQLAPAFEGGGQAVDALVGKFSTLGVTMSGPTIEKLAAVDQKVKDLKAGFGKIGPEMLVAFAPLIDVISSTLLPLLPMVAEQIAPIVQQLAEGLGPVIQSVLPLFGDMIKELMPLLSALIPVVVQVATVLVSALGPVLRGIVPVLSQVMQAILPLVPTLLNALLPAFLALVPALVALAVALVPLIEQLMPVLVQLVTDLTPIITMLANILTALLVPAIDIISSATAMWIAGLSVLGSTLTIAINAVKLLWAAFTGNGEAMAAASGALDTAFADWWSAITGFGDKILGYFTAIWDGVKSGLSGALAAVGIGTGSVSVEAVASGASRAAVANAPTANVNATTNQSTTLTDQRSVNISVSGAPTPGAVASAVSSSLDNVFTSDRSRTLASVAPAG